MKHLPIELHHIIASFLLPPVYRLADCLTDTIHWEGLCLNPHPGMVPLVDAYFERCLSIQSYLDWTMLLHLDRNPAARPLVDKYGYFFLILLNSQYTDIPRIELPSLSQDLIESIEHGTINVKELHPQLLERIYAYPGIFQVDTARTREAIHQWTSQFSYKIKTIGLIEDAQRIQISTPNVKALLYEDAL
jgi:hypothetical protein